MVTEPYVPPNCTCGCTLRNRPSGFIASSPDVCHPTTQTLVGTWLVWMPDYKRVRLEFELFNLHLQQEWMRIRDGGDATAKVLAYHTGSRLPGPVLSTGNKLYIEYKVYSRSGEEPTRGFRARYSSIGKDITIVQIQDWRGRSWVQVRPVWFYPHRFRKAQTHCAYFTLQRWGQSQKSFHQLSPD